MRELKVSPAQREAIIQKGGPTFSPRSGGWLVCNQAPEFGRLKKNQADILRNICHPHKHVSPGPRIPVKPAAPPSKDTPLSAKLIPPLGDVICPACKGMLWDVKTPKIFRCWKCNQRVSAYR